MNTDYHKYMYNINEEVNAAILSGWLFDNSQYLFGM